MRRSDVQDAALAVGVLALGQLDTWVPDAVSTNLVGPRWAIGLCYAVAALALGWRRRMPFATFCVVVAVFALQAVLIGASEGNGVLVPAAIAAYSVAAHGTRRQSFLALGLIVALAAVREVRNPENVTVAATADALAWDLLIVAAWLLGAYLRTRRLYVAELADRAARAERDREDRAAAAAAQERTRIAREMHDVLAHSVSVMVVQAEAAEEMLDRDPARARRALGMVQDTGREALVELRRTLDILRATAGTERTPQPGLASIPSLATEVEQAGLPVNVTVSGTAVALPPGLDLAAFRIVQEALTNAVKHAGAHRADLLIEYTPNTLCLEVRDDGTGQLAGSPNGIGHGLVGMRERAEFYGGDVHAGPASGGGYLVRARLPLDSST